MAKLLSYEIYSALEERKWRNNDGTVRNKEGLTEGTKKNSTTYAGNIRSDY